MNICEQLVINSEIYGIILHLWQYQSLICSIGNYVCCANENLFSFLKFAEMLRRYDFIK